jgi:hypothetical protein
LVMPFASSHLPKMGWYICQKLSKYRCLAWQSRGCLNLWRGMDLTFDPTLTKIRNPSRKKGHFFRFTFDPTPL